VTPELFQFEFSHFNEKARWAFDWKRVPHRRQSYLPGFHMLPIMRLSGQRAVPVVRVDGRVIAGSASIVDWLEGVRPRTSGKVYLSIDLDGLDPAYAPGVSHLEPGGLSTREVLRLVQELGGSLVGADVVEYNPDRDAGGLTAAVAAKIVKEIAGRMLAEAS